MHYNYFKLIPFQAPQAKKSTTSESGRQEASEVEHKRSSSVRPDPDEVSL